MQPTIVTLTGMTCSGKSTLERMLKDRGYASLMSTTTRAPREGEVDGVHYHFISESEFLDAKRRGFFIEAVEFNGHHYGVSVRDMNVVTAENRPAVIVVEPGGRDQIVTFAKRHNWKVYNVFVDNSNKIIAKRFMERYLNDLATNDKSDATTLTERYVARFASMLGEETEWRDEAYRDVHPYHYEAYTLEFDGPKSDESVERICALVGFGQKTQKVA